MCRHNCRSGSGRGRGPAAGGAQVCPGTARERHRLTWAGAARSHTLVGSRDLRSEILAWICRRFGWELTLQTLLLASGVRTEPLNTFPCARCKSQPRQSCASCPFGYIPVLMSPVRSPEHTCPGLPAEARCCRDVTGTGVRTEPLNTFPCARCKSQPQQSCASCPFGYIPVLMSPVRSPEHICPGLPAEARCCHDVTGTVTGLILGSHATQGSTDGRSCDVMAKQMWGRGRRP
uniref:Uncharacterized protein n=1 Tax=Branchiostoma floridae TaxID=7739 RepID=C3ZU04_BRAFL|eukprot:XP_002587879.1 hypothetical protein BRAFLDRAFT_87266 [Branchiostoma floridae]